ncbi:hypothetical protein [Paludisphaera rhizosphaerae]|uniref:hypothetical protein n=1 Tax=Paludisphaera rhizosphaerae TaxID=2711216 RepID=UPI0013EB553E|nr:hypothetical protein [Paludisphaera rhizosphaerae]
MIDNSAITEAIQRARDPQGSIEEVGEALRTAFSRREASDRRAVEKAMGRLADKIIDAPTRTDAAATAALYCGGLVERGLDPTIAVEAVLNRIERQIGPEALAFASACKKAAPKKRKRSADAEDQMDPVEEFGDQVAQRMPAETGSFQMLEPFSLAAVAMLGRSPDARRASRSRTALRQTLNDLGGQYGYAGLLWMMMQVLDDEPLLVLHPGEGKGYRVQISGLGDNFQLHTLLADALVGEPSQGWLPGRHPTPAEAAAARDAEVGEDSPPAKGSFNLWTWRGIRRDGKLDKSKDQSDHWIWNEGVPADIPRFQGVRIVLLSPPPYDRGWSAGRKFPFMPGELTLVGRLMDDQVRDLLRRFAEASE